MIPNQIEVNLKSEVSKSFRCQMAANSLDIDTNKKSEHNLKILEINPKQDWNIGLIYGSSGSGKTTLAKKMFGDDCFKAILDDSKPILEQFDNSMSYDECASILNGIGLNTVPCWIRPVYTLSNGQRARAEAALLMTQSEDIVCIDEWTSVVDRTVAKAMSLCIHKHAKKHNKKVILLSCHYDILEWLKPDWMIDCNKQEFYNRENEAFFFQPREQLNFTIKKIGRESWKYFSKYHYLSDRLPGGEIHCFGLFHNDNQIGFQCFANYVPHRPNTKKIFHSNRTVVHPDYNGMGLGIELINKTSHWMKTNLRNIKVMAKFSSVPVFKAMIKQQDWKFVEEKYTMGKLGVGGNMDRKSGFREKGVKTYHFLYIGK